MYEYNTASIESGLGDRKIHGVVKSFFNDILSIQLSDECNFDLGETLTIRIYDKLNGYSIYSGIIKEYSNRVITLHCVVLDNTVQRRKSKRLLVSTPTNINKIMINKKKLLELDKTILMKAKDISSTGILLESPLDLPENINFLIDLTIENYTVKLNTTTMRKYKKNNLYYYGCTFSVENEIQHSILIKYINNRYINQIRNQSSNIPCYFNR